MEDLTRINWNKKSCNTCLKGLLNHFTANYVCPVSSICKNWSHWQPHGKCGLSITLKYDELAR